MRTSTEFGVELTVDGDAAGDVAGETRVYGENEARQIKWPFCAQSKTIHVGGF